ncbi:MAG: hypothetical protein M3393_07210 [Actinomycetota bacterium]|nr:hypothetical protein [Actinomycetota bacterium]
MSDSTVFLHVGLPKSGTTYMQAVFTANKERLRERAGVLFPGTDWDDQVQAVRDVRQMHRTPEKGSKVEGAWSRLVAEISAWGGDAVVSMEWLCAAEPDHIRRIVDDLSPGRVEAVFTVRDLGRTLPAAWQEFMQNRGEWSWREFLEGVVAEDLLATRAGQRFWSQQDMAALLTNWTKVLPAGQIHVVTLPHPGAPPDLLWRRMSRVLGVDDAGYATEGTIGNASLGLESAELMRRLNPLARKAGMRKSLYQHVLKHGVAKTVLAERKNGESRLGLPVAYHDWARERAGQQIEAIEAAQVSVVGNLADLRPVLDARGTRQPEDVPDDALLQSCLMVLVAVARQWDLTRRETKTLRQENAGLQERLEFSARHVGHLTERIRQLEVRLARAGPVPRRGGPGPEPDGQLSREVI